MNANNDSVPQDKAVVYHAEGDTRDVWVRSLAEFTEIGRDGVPRFEIIRPSEQ